MSESLLKRVGKIDFTERNKICDIFGVAERHFPDPCH